MAEADTERLDKLERYILKGCDLGLDTRFTGTGIGSLRQAIDALKGGGE